jgi:hypothetical protein
MCFIFIYTSSAVAEMRVTELHNLHISELRNCKHAESDAKFLVGPTPSYIHCDFEGLLGRDYEDDYILVCDTL